MFRSREQALALAVALLVWLLLVVVPALRNGLGGFESGLLDVRMALLDFPVDPRIRVFCLDDATLEATGGWSTDSVSTLLGRLGDHGAAGVFLQDRPQVGDGVLDPSAAGLAGRLVVDWGPGFAGAVRAPTTPLDPDSDGIVRRVALGVPDSSGRVRPVPTLVLTAWLDGVDPATVEFGRDYVQVGPRRIPTDERHRLLVHFRAGLKEQLASAGFVALPLEPIPAARLLERESRVLGTLKGSAVVIGSRLNEAADEVQTGRGLVRRLDVEANLLDTLLSNRYVRRPGEVAQALVLLAICLSLALVMTRVRLGVALTAAVAVLGGYGVLNFYLFTRGLWLDLALPLAGGAVVAAACVVLLWLRSRKLLREFLAPDVAEQVLRSHQAAALGGVEKVCTILFYSLPPCLKSGDGQSPELQLRRRNEFTDMATAILVRHDGRVMDFQGDAQMVLFGAPRERPDHAAAATEAALEVLRCGEELTKHWGFEEEAQRRIHAGICTGPLAVGFVGSEDHKEFAAIGDTTNVAARLYAAAMKMDIPVLVAGASVESAGGLIEAEALPPIPLKGKTEPVPVFRALSVFRLRGDAP